MWPRCPGSGDHEVLRGGPPPDAPQAPRAGSGERGDPARSGTGRGPGPSVCGMTVEELLAVQSGVVTRAQALAAGVPRAEVDRRVRLRLWRPLHPGVYLAAGYPHDAVVAVRAAVLWAGGGAVLDGAAAAWWWGLRAEAPRAVGITVPRSRQARSRPGVVVRRRDLAPDDVGLRRGVAVTAPPLTVLDTAVDLGADGPAFLDRMLREAVPRAAVLAAHRRSAGTPGAVAGGRLLAGRPDRARVTGGGARPARRGPVRG
jgi:hypothetical protein